MKDNVTEKSKQSRWYVLCLWALSSAAPWIAMRLFLTFPYTHRIIHVVSEPFRYKFADISQWGLWALSLVFCFGNPVEAVMKGNNRYALAAVFSFLLYIGHVGSEDSRKSNEAQQQIIRNMEYAIRQLPREVKHEMDAELNTRMAKGYKFKRDDFMLFLNNHPFGIKFWSTFPDFKETGIFSLAVKNLNENHTMSDFFVDFVMDGCNFKSDDQRWSVGTSNGAKALSLSYSKSGLNPITPSGNMQLLPDILYDCRGSSNASIFLQVRLPDSAALSFGKIFLNKRLRG